MRTISNFTGYVDVGACAVSGYQFLTDSAQAIRAELGSKVSDNDALISDDWSSSQLLGIWSDASLASVNAHFNHFQAFADDPNNTYVLSTDLVDSLKNQVGYSMGCHGGLNVPDGLSNGTSTADFPQIYAQNDATAWVANTGYGYGMDDAITNSELLYLYFTQELTDGPTSIGKALVQAKGRYLSDVAASGFGVYDEKILIEATVYGLPMVQVNGLIPSPDASGLTVNFNGGSFKVTAFASPTVTDDGTFYAIQGNVLASPGWPIQPRGSFVASDYQTPDPGEILTGLILMNATFSDEFGFDPVIAMPSWDDSETEPAYDQIGWFPANLWTVNSISGEDYVVLVPGQYNLEGSVQRLFSFLEFKPVYGDPDQIDGLPPSIESAWAEETDGGITIFVRASDAGSGVTEVYATYVAGGQLYTLPLENDSVDGTWSASVLNQDIDTEFLVQAVDAAGNTVADTNSGRLYAGPPTDLIINFVGDPHTFVITVYADTGNGGSRVVVGAEPDVEVSSPDGANPTFETDCSDETGASVYGTDGNGQCSVIVNATEPGSVDVSTTVVLDNVLNLAASASTRARKIFITPFGKIAPTQTTCEMYVDGTAEDLDSVTYGTKGNVINNAAPGVFFYYTRFQAPSENFTIVIDQTSDPAFKLFEVQNLSQIRWFNANCGSPSGTFTPIINPDGQASIEVAGANPGDEIVISVKFDTGSFVGENKPSGEVLHDFATFVDGEKLDFDASGLKLDRKR
jgi:hypothetical protein